jgi:molybdate transport system ATP-binding protein
MSEVLHADFVRRYSSGATVHAAFDLPSTGASVTVLFGPSGGGKTTILRCLAGLDRPQSGHIQFATQIWFDTGSKVMLPPQRRGIGFLFQDYGLFPHLSVESNIGYGLSRLRFRECRQRIVELLSILDLDGLSKRKPHELSAGQQQRVALARAIAPRPRLLLLDEPLSALDAPTRETLRRELRRLLVQFATPAIVVTHDLTEAIALADSAIIIDQGKILQAGPLSEVFSRPADDRVARIVGVETIEAGNVTSIADGLATVRVGSADLLAVASASPIGPASVFIRGEDVILERAATADTSARNRLPATVKWITPEGALVRVGLDAGMPLTALITRPACESLRLQVGDQLLALIKAQAIHLSPR